MRSSARHRTWIGTLVTLAAYASLGALAGRARAQSCEQDADCPDKFSCEITGTIECPSSGSERHSGGQKGEGQASCVPQDYRECVSPSCEGDGDCPRDMVCYEQTATQCGGSTPSCDPNGECPAPVDAGAPGCTETSERSCVPRYVPPCTEDADCGEGFSCEEESIPSCSGGGSVGSGTGTGGAASSLDGGQATPPDSETHCTTTPTGKLHCVLKAIACDDASDCPDGFSCEDDPNQATCVDTEPAPAGGDDSAGGSDEARCPDAGVRTKVCLPPYSDLTGAGRGGKGESTDGSGHGTTEQPPTTPTKKSSSGCSAAPGESDATTASLALLALSCFMLGARSRRRDAVRG